jgi:hypothetical protein
MNRQELIEEAAVGIVTARDLCGSEKSAIRQVEEDYGIKFTFEEKAAAFDAANAIWRGFQIQAGVTHPLSTFERQDAFNAIQNA